jgi:hypothetical protein
MFAAMAPPMTPRVDAKITTKGIIKVPAIILGVKR